MIEGGFRLTFALGSKARRIAVTSQKSFGFMAALSYGQWICHSPNVMKTDIFQVENGTRSRDSTRGSIKFDSSWQVRLQGLIQFVEIHCRKFASRYPESIIRRSAIFLAIAA